MKKEDLKEEEKQEMTELSERKVMVYNLSYSASIEDIKLVFENFCKVDKIIIPRDIEGYPKGYAFVYLKDKQDVPKVLEYVD